MKNYIRSFKQNGFVVIPQIIPSKRAELMYRTALDQFHHPTRPYELESALGYPGAPQPTSLEGKATIRRLRSAYDRHELWRQWAHDPTLLKYIALLLNSRRISLTKAHHNCIMTKTPEWSSRTGWHQDIRYWSFEHQTLVTAWLSLTNENEKNGCIQVIPGSQDKTFDQGQFDEHQFFRNDLDENQLMIKDARSIDSKRGDLLLFDSRLLHRAGENTTKEVKLSLVFTYKLDSNKAIEHTRSSSIDEIKMENEFTFSTIPNKETQS